MKRNSRFGPAPPGPVNDQTRRLSERERQLVELAAQGLTDKEMVDRLGLRHATVHTYWRRVFKKLAVRNRAAAVARTRLPSVSPKKGT